MAEGDLPFSILVVGVMSVLAGPNVVADPPQPTEKLTLLASKCSQLVESKSLWNAESDYANEGRLPFLHDRSSKLVVSTNA